MTQTRTAAPARVLRRGFTIIEVMIVLVILGLIGGIVTINLVGASDQARIDTTKLSMETVVSGLGKYRAKHSKYPDTDNWKQQLGNLFTGNQLKDAWGNEFVYAQMNEGTSFELWSNGPDGEPLTDDDFMVGPDHE